ncbi:MAG: helix-turn-helix transcriptional regulator [Bacterioplanes sp.]|nr:helix-turn-helix transcriptional regulator [Bacterioplanes sp.]
MSIALYLSDKRTVLIGQPPPMTQMQAPAATLIMALDTDQPNGQLLRPSTPLHQWPSPGAVAVCFLDVLGHDWHTLSLLMNETQQWHVPSVAPLFELMKSAWQQPTDANQLFWALENTLQEERDKRTTPHSVDTRIVATLQRIREDIALNVAIKDLAEAVGLSEAHLSQCFKKQTGVALRRYRLWHRVFRTAIAITEGETLTAAALAAGFTDSAHFAHTFQSLFGFAPSQLFASLCKHPNQALASRELNASLHWAS